MHFLISILFLILFMAVITAYLLVGYCLLRSVPYLIQRIKKRDVTFFVGSFKKVLLSCLSVVLIFYLSLYITNRIKWCGDDNTHLKAKQYFAAGQPLAGLRLVLTKVLNPDNPILVPLNGLQRLIYMQGTRYLPEDDGEIGVWNDLWFNYPYVQRTHLPYGTDKRKPSYRMRKLLDSIWFSLEQMSTKPFADKQMEEEQYFRNFPRMAFYYTINNGYYHDRLIGAGKDLHQDPKFVKHLELLSSWLADLRDRWIKAGLYDDIKQKTPKIEALRQEVSIDVLGSLIRASIYPGNFSCNDPNIPLYIKARRDFADPKSSNYVWERLHRRKKKQAELIYQVAIDSIASSFQKYIIEHYCGMNVPGEEEYFGMDKRFHHKTLESSIKHLFRYELDSIEEKYHGHEN